MTARRSAWAQLLRPAYYTFGGRVHRIRINHSFVMGLTAQCSGE